MPTHNERTIPSPDRDEELEKFINSVISGTRCNLYNLSDVSVSGYTDFLVRQMIEKVAAFSARRAREKAIEECIGHIKTMRSAQIMVSDKKENCIGSIALGIAIEYLTKLKSPTN